MHARLLPRAQTIRLGAHYCVAGAVCERGINPGVQRREASAGLSALGLTIARVRIL